MWTLTVNHTTPHVHKAAHGSRFWFPYQLIQRIEMASRINSSCNKILIKNTGSHTVTQCTKLQYYNTLLHVFIIVEGVIPFLRHYYTLYPHSARCNAIVLNAINKPHVNGKDSSVSNLRYMAMRISRPTRVQLCRTLKRERVLYLQDCICESAFIKQSSETGNAIAI